MRTAKIDRIRRRVLKQALADNLDTIRGLPPRAVRPANRLMRLWMRRTPLVVIVLLLAGSTYLASNPAPAREDTIAPAKIVVTRPPRPAGSLPTTIDATPIDASAFALAVHRVVIDAGHGGNDPGATVPLQFAEKEITLDIAKRLGALLEQHGFEVVTTRSDDRLVPLRERATLANRSQSDIFVSIHVNSILDHTASRGIETYYLGPTSDPSLTRLAADENRVSGYSVADLRKLLDGIYAGVRSNESERLARAVQQQLFSTLRNSDGALENWGVKRAPFVVLVATDMPSILAEVGCMSSNDEVAMLRDPAYRQKIAGALYQGIHAYAAASEAPQKKGT